MTFGRTTDPGGLRGRPGTTGGWRAAHFTLIEVLVAVTVFLLVATVMFGFLRETTRTWEKLRLEHARFHALLALDRAMDNLLTNAIPFHWTDAEGQEVPFFIGEPDFLRAATLHPVSHTGDGAVRFCELFVDSNRLICFYTQRPYIDTDVPDDLARATVLAEGVERVEFTYADWADERSGDWGHRLSWIDSWDPEREELPLAIMITVTWQDGRIESWLRRAAGMGYRERWGTWQPETSE